MTVPLLLFETARATHESGSWVVVQIEHLKEEFGPGLFGGFLGYFVHTIHHRIFHTLHNVTPRLAGRILPRRMRGGGAH